MTTISYKSYDNNFTDQNRTQKNEKSFRFVFNPKIITFFFLYDKSSTFLYIKTKFILYLRFGKL